MKAWIHDEVGDLDKLQLRDHQTPEPGPNDVLIRNRAIGLNPVDWKFIEWGHDAWTWPHIPGVDGAGEVEAVGENVLNLAVGTRVAYHNDLTKPGSFAEYTVIPARAAIPLPNALSYAAAATIPCPGLTAYQAISKVSLWPGAHVLVTGASGAVGGALLQLARERGWIIHALASASQEDRLFGLGAATVTDYKKVGWREDWALHVKRQPLNAVFDMVNGAHAASLAPLLTANGHLVCIQDRQETAPLPAFTTTISVHEVGLNAMHAFGCNQQWGTLVKAGVEIAQAITVGEFDPQIIDCASFDQLPDALKRLKSGPNPGNRVVTL